MPDDGDNEYREKARVPGRAKRMADRQLNDVLQHIRKLAAAQTAESLPDRDLLARFVADRDEAAFTALVERHAALVLGVCRRVLRHAHDTEDACQAVFLVLARKA